MFFCAELIVIDIWYFHYLKMEICEKINCYCRCFMKCLTIELLVLVICEHPNYITLIN